MGVTGVYCRGWDGGVGDVEEGKWEETDNDDQEKVFCEVSKL